MTYASFVSSAAPCPAVRVGLYCSLLCMSGWVKDELFLGDRSLVPNIPSSPGLNDVSLSCGDCVRGLLLIRVKYERWRLRQGREIVTTSILRHLFDLASPAAVICCHEILAQVDLRWRQLSGVIGSDQVLVAEHACRQYVYVSASDTRLALACNLLLAGAARSFVDVVDD